VNKNKRQKKKKKIMLQSYNSHFIYRRKLVEYDLLLLWCRVWSCWTTLSYIKCWKTRNFKSIFELN